MRSTRFSIRNVLLIAQGVFLLAAQVAAQSIFTVAGGFSSEGRPATVVGLNQPEGLALGPAGSLFIAEGFEHRVRRLDLKTGVITTLAGDGTGGFRGDGGPATEAILYSPGDVALDSRGNLYIAIRIGSRVRKIDLNTGIITTVAGNGLPFHEGDGGPAKNAGFFYPTGVAVDAADNVYVADSREHRVRRIDAVTGIITTFAGTGTGGFSGDGGPANRAQLNEPLRLAVDATGNVYIADSLNYRIRKVSADTKTITTIAGNGMSGFSGDGGPATAAQMRDPEGVEVDSSGNVYIADYFNQRIRRVDASSGIIRTIAGTGTSGFSGDGGPATAARLFFPQGLEIDSQGTLYFSDYANRRVRRIDSATGVITTIAGNGETGFVGDGGLATAAELSSPRGVAVDSAGNLFIADSQGRRIRKIDRKTGLISTVVGTGASGSSGDGGPATRAQLTSPADVAFDSSDNLYIADTFGLRIRRVDALTGIIRTVAGNGSGAFAGDRGPATAASLLYPSDVAVDAAGNIYLNDYTNHRVRKVTAATGTIDTYAGNGVGAGNEFQGSFSGDGGPASAAGLNNPRGLAVDRQGDLYIADHYNNRIRKVNSTTGVITTVVGSGPVGTGQGRFGGDGGPATAATMHEAFDVFLDSSGNIFVGELGRVRKVDATTGVIRTVAGNGGSNSLGDGGAALAAGIPAARSVTVDSAGNLYITDSFSRLRGVLACVNVTVPALGSPADRSSGVSQSPRLAWTPVSGAFRYDVLLDTANPPKQIIAADIVTAGFAPSNLEPLVTYYWQVVAKGDPFCNPPSSAPSAVFSFTTTSSCTNPGPFEVTP